MHAMTVVPGRKGTAGVQTVDEPPVGSGFERGDLVGGIVSRPDPVPCPACAARHWDMCRNDRFIERGIVRGPGCGSERRRVEPRFAVSLPRRVGDLGVLLDPASMLGLGRYTIGALMLSSPTVTASDSGAMI